MIKKNGFVIVVTVLAILSVTACSIFKSSNESGNQKTTSTNDSNRIIVDVTPPEINREKLEEGLNIGNIAPDIELENPKGKTMKLSSLEGKMVLIDFWASWCGPCRRENPNLVRAYQKYNEAELKNASGFEIYSVSLDRNREAWTKAIGDDGLIWDYHVSDLKFWNSEAAKTYGINSIPYNLLLNAQGVIVATNLRGIVLDKTMDEYVEKL